MKLYHKNAASERRLRFGIDLIHLLGHFPETASLEEELRAPQARLQDILDERERRELALIKARSDVRVWELHVDRRIRRFAHAVKARGHGAQSPIYQALFPAGLRDVVGPSGRAQLPPLGALILRLKEHGLAAPLREEWLADLEELHRRFAAAIALLGQAEDELREAFDRERVARDHHRTAVLRIDGGLRRLYAGDRSLLRVFQPTLGLSRSRPKATGTEPPASAA